MSYMCVVIVCATLLGGAFFAIDGLLGERPSFLRWATGMAVLGLGAGLLWGPR